MSTTPDYQPQPTTSQLIEKHGVWLGGRACSGCGNKRVFAIQYGSGTDDRFLLCDRCDTQKEVK